MPPRLSLAGADNRRLRETRTTAHVIRKTASSFAANRWSFIFLALVLLLFRVLVEFGTHYFTTTYVDPKYPPTSALDDHRHLIPPAAFRRTFNSEDRTPFDSTCRAPVNATSLTLSDYDPELGFCDLDVRNAFRVSQILGPGLTCAADSFSLEDGSLGYETVRGFGRLQFIKELDDDSVPSSLVLMSLAVYLWTILIFWWVYASVLGIVFFTVVNDLLDGSRSFMRVIGDGYRLGHRTLFMGAFIMRWAVRETLAICIMLGTLWCFGEIEDWHSLSMMFLRIKLMPFSIMSPSIRGFDNEISWFLFTWLLLDTVFACIYSVDVWVGIVDARSGRKIVKSGGFWIMMSPLKNQASQVNCLEVLCCGSFGRWILTWLFGKSLASGVQAVMEVYFMAVWLIFYLAARCRDANADGMEFGLGELEKLIRNLRK